MLASPPVRPTPPNRLRLALAILAIGALGGFTWGEKAPGHRTAWGAPIDQTRQAALATRRAQLDATLAAELTDLAAKCDQLGLKAQAATTRSWLIPRDPRRRYFFLPEAEDPTEPKAGSPQVVQYWHRKFRELRNAYAAQLFTLAGDALAAHDLESAYALVHETLREDPDHEAARRMLGHTRIAGRWQTPAVAARARAARVGHATLPWKAGRYWRVETAHFEVVTNDSPKAGLELAARLEDLYAVWQQLFVRYWTSEDALRASYQGAAGQRRATAPHRVVLFRDRQGYVEYLAQAEPNIGITLGIYLDSQRTAYFFSGDDRSGATWFHEATHQLFHETRSASAGVGLQANFWFVEGIALYMESLDRHDGYYTVGGVAADRLQFARYRALNEQFYVPLAELVGLGREALQQDERIRRLYSQAAGLAHFLMDYDGGRYRQAAMDYLLSIYTERDDRRTLAGLVGDDWPRLDQQYRQFLDVSDADLGWVKEETDTARLCLGHTSVTDAGLKHLAGWEQLVWLDLSSTAASDAGLASLGALPELKQLNLERTRMTDAALKEIARWPQLEELDLSELPITDAGLAQLGGFRRLTVLWLTGTAVTDASLPVVRNFKQLQTLDVSRSGFTPAGWQQLQQALPALKKEE